MISTARVDAPPTCPEPRVRRAVAAVALVPVLVAAAACGGSDRSNVPAAPSPSATSAAPASQTSPARPGLEIDPRAPLTQKVRSAFYEPFTLRIPEGWTSVLRDVAAYQVYVGNEEYEITFDHTYTAKESVTEAVSRLKATPGLEAGPELPVMIGHRQGTGFEASSDAAVRFDDSGFHTNEPAKLQVFAIPADDGTTITVFLTAGADPHHGVDSLAPLARRIFKTVRWE